VVSQSFSIAPLTKDLLRCEKYTKQEKLTWFIPSASKMLENSFILFLKRVVLELLRRCFFGDSVMLLVSLIITAYSIFGLKIVHRGDILAFFEFHSFGEAVV